MTDVVAGAAGSLIGGSIAGGASKQAAQIQADAQVKAANIAAQTQMNMFNTEVANEQPFIKAGQGAVGQLSQALAPGGSLTQNFSLSDLQTDPGYLFDLQQGNQAVQRSAAAGGTLNSGGTLKAIANYTTGLASNEITNAFNRYTTNQTNQYNRLSGLAGIGSNAAGLLDQSGTQIANSLATTQAQTAVGAGNAQAAGVVGGANALSQAITGATNTYSQYTTLNKLLSGINGTSGSTNLAKSYVNSSPQAQVAQDVSDEQPSYLSQVGNWASSLFS